MNSAFAIRPTFTSFAERSPASPGRGLWLPLAVWVFVITTLASFRVRHAEDLWADGGIDWQVKYQAASWVVLGLLAAWLLVRGLADLSLLRQGPLFWYCAYIVVALLSAVLAPSPLLTAFRAVQLAVAVVLVISMKRRLDYLYLFLCVFLGLNWALLILGALGIGTQLEWIRPPQELFIFHAGSRDDAWRFGTAFGHPSQISAVAAVVAVGLAARARGRQWLTLGPIIAWCVATNLMTVSRTGIAGMLGGFLVVAWYRRKLLPLSLLTGILAPLVLWPADTQDAVAGYLARGQSAKELASLTGRDMVFVEGWNRVVDTAFLGEGFAAGRTHLLAKSWGASHAHNLFLQAATSLGLPGLVLITLVIGTYLRDVGRLLWGGHSGRPAGLASPPSSAFALRMGRTSNIEHPTSNIERNTHREPTGTAVEFAAIAVPLIACCLLDSGFAAAIDPFLLMFLGVAARLGQQVSLHVGESLRDSQRHLTAARPLGGNGRRTSPLLTSNGVP